MIYLDLIFRSKYFILYLDHRFRTVIFLILYPVIFVMCMDSTVLVLTLKAIKSVPNSEFST